MQKNKFEIWVLKFTILNPRKRKKCVFAFWRKTPNNFFLMFRLWFSFKNNWLTNVLLVGNFEIPQKKLLTFKNTILAVLAVNNFFCAFSKIRTIITLVCLLFLKLKQKNMKKIICFWRFLIQNSKMPFFGGQPIVFLHHFFLF